MSKRILASVLMVLMSALLLFACSEDKTNENASLSDPELVGTWEGTDHSLTYSYTFDFESKGTTTVSYNDDRETFSFTWKTNNNTLSLTFLEGDSTHTQELSYEINENTLTLKHETNVLTLTKK